MIPPIAEVVYEARRAIKPRMFENEDGVAQEADTGLPFDQLTSDEREPLLAEVQAYLQSGTPMYDALGQAIVDALK